MLFLAAHWINDGHHCGSGITGTTQAKCPRSKKYCAACMQTSPFPINTTLAIRSILAHWLKTKAIDFSAAINLPAASRGSLDRFVRKVHLASTINRFYLVSDHMCQLLQNRNLYPFNFSSRTIENTTNNFKKHANVMLCNYQSSGVQEGIAAVGLIYQLHGKPRHLKARPPPGYPTRLPSCRPRACLRLPGSVPQTVNEPIVVHVAHSPTAILGRSSCLYRLEWQGFWRFRTLYTRNACGLSSR